MAINEYTPKDVTRFWSKVDRSQGKDACWLWLAGRDTCGYGFFWFKGTHHAQRIAWELTNGAIPDGMLVCHHCDNPGCVNPAHLWLGTQKDNMRDMLRKGRGNKASGERNGRYTHPARSARGERSGRAKLTEEIVCESRRRYINGEINISKLAREHGVNRDTMADAIKGKTWKHIVNPFPYLDPFGLS